MIRRAGITLAALATLITLAVPAVATAAPAPAAAQIRVNQVGYQPDAPKAGYVMLPARVASVPFTVTDARGTVVYRGVSRDDVGAWNSRYEAVYLLSFSGLRQRGTYRLRAASAVSPAFRIASGSTL